MFKCGLYLRSFKSFQSSKKFNKISCFHVPRDRFRTTINVMCDALGTIIVDHLSKGELGANPMRIVRNPKNTFR